MNILHRTVSRSESTNREEVNHEESSSAFGLVLTYRLGLSRPGSCSGRKTESFSGKVTSVDPDGKAIVIESGTGKAALTVGAIVTPTTVLMVKGKKAAIADLAKEVKVGDMVSLKISGRPISTRKKFPRSNQFAADGRG